MEEYITPNYETISTPHDLAGCDDNDLVRWINEQPTADVVPKSEVDEIIGAFDTWLYKHYNGDISDWDLYKLFAELKKKYT